MHAGPMGILLMDGWSGSSGLSIEKSKNCHGHVFGCMGRGGLWIRELVCVCRGDDLSMGVIVVACMVLPSMSQL